MAIRTRFGCAALALLALAGCTGENGLYPGASKDNFGEANRQTFAAQVINPAPVYDSAYIGGSAEMAAKAIERYRTDRVKKPDGQSLSTLGSGSAGARGGN